MSDLMTSANGRAVHRLLVLICLLALSGCGPTKVDVKGSFPQPLIEPLPLNLGVWYSPEFSSHEFSDDGSSRDEGSWVVKTGEAQVQMWDILLAGMFRRFEHMPIEPAPDTDNPVVDAILVPSVQELQYTIPTHTNTKIYEIWLRYHFKLVQMDGSPIAEWTMTSYGKTPTAFMQSNAAAVNLAAVVALRDAGANFATGFTRVPDVETWLAEKWDSPAATPLSADEEELP